VPPLPPLPPGLTGWLPVGDGQYVRSFRLVGGNATVRAGRGEATLASATPQPGFVMTVMPTGADQVVVNFVGALQISTLSVGWSENAPTVETTEIP